MTDIVWLPTVRRLVNCGYDVSKRHPRLAAWHAAMAEAFPDDLEEMDALAYATQAYLYLSGGDFEQTAARIGL